MFVPAPPAIPHIPLSTLASWRDMAFADVVGEVLALFTTPSDPLLTCEEVRTIARQALQTHDGGFQHPDIAPLVPKPDAPNTYVLELFHGPTQAFKDLGMAVLAHILQHILAKQDKRIKLLVGTSGDTGASAAHAVASCANLSIAVLYPSRQFSNVSDVQEHQTLDAVSDQCAVVECMGTSDDLDRPINKAFANDELRTTHNLGSVNSVNVVRLLVQCAFFAYAATRLPSHAAATFVVPTGAAGHVAGGALAKLIGIPINKLVSAGNANRAFVDLLNDDSLDGSKPTVTTSSPSMDIRLPYNLERIVYWAGGSDEASSVAATMASNGKVLLSPEIKEAISEKLGIAAAHAEDDQVADAIRFEFTKHGTLYDPHSAVGIAAARSQNLEGTDEHPLVFMACAHPAKFPSTIHDIVPECHLDSLVAQNSSEPPTPTRIFERDTDWYRQLVEVLESLP